MAENMLPRRRWRLCGRGAWAALAGLALRVAASAVPDPALAAPRARVGRSAHGLACATGAQLEPQPEPLPSCCPAPSDRTEPDAASDEFQEAVNEGLPLVVDFTTPGCGPCQAMGKVLDSVQREFAGRLQVLRLPVHSNAALARVLGVSRVPTVLLFGGGSADPVHRFVGAAKEQKVRSRIIQKLLS